VHQKLKIAVVRAARVRETSIVQQLLLRPFHHEVHYQRKREDVFKHAEDDVESSHDNEGIQQSHVCRATVANGSQFMQRSASKATASSPSTPNGPPSKKMRLSSGYSAPGTPGTPDHVILQSALEAEEKKRQDALDKAAQHTGETKWVLSFKDPLEGKRKEALQVRHAGFAEIDADGDSEEDEEVQPIRKQFGGGVKRKEVRVMTEVQQS